MKVILTVDYLKKDMPYEKKYKADILIKDFLLIGGEEYICIELPNGDKLYVDSLDLYRTISFIVKK